jgi:hypothetical protein
MFYLTIYYGTWVLSSLACLIAAAQLWRSNRHSEFRIFFVYLILAGLHGVANLALSLFSPGAWFFSFHVGSLLTSLLGFAVLYEASKAALSTPLFNLRSSSFLGFCAAAAVVAVSVCAAVEVSGPAFLRARVLLELALRLTQVSILIVFGAASAFYGLFWHRTEFGIVLGYGCYASVQLALMAHRASSPDRFAPHIVLIPMLSFLASTIIWLLYSRKRAAMPTVDFKMLGAEMDESLRFAQRMQG